MNKNPNTLNTTPLFLAKGHENASALILLRSNILGGERRRYLKGWQEREMLRVDSTRPRIGTRAGLSSGIMGQVLLALVGGDPFW